MKAKVIIILVVAAAALVFQARSLKKARSSAQTAQTALADAQSALATAESRAAVLEKELRQLRGQAVALESSLAKAQAPVADSSAPSVANGAPAPAISLAAAASSPAKKDGGMGGMLSKMMSNPEMRKAMEQQQRMMMDTMYAPLWKKLGLNPEQESQLKDLLVETQTAGMAHAGDLFDGTPEARQEASKKIAAENEQRQEKIKELLGDEKFEQYKGYQETMGERMMLTQFGKSANISDDQTEQLLGLMREEKRSVQLNHAADFSDPAKNMEMMTGSPEAMENLLRQQEEVNARVLERAGGFLSAEQVKQLGPAFKSQLEMTRMGMNMARGMFGGAAPASPAPPAAPIPQ